MDKDSRWWNQYGIHCPKCHVNLVNKVIPASIMDHREFFTDKDIKYDLKLKKAELEKYIVENSLVFHELKDEQGSTYLLVFLKDENVDFVKGRKLRRFMPPQFIDDVKGGRYQL